VIVFSALPPIFHKKQTHTPKTKSNRTNTQILLPRALIPQKKKHASVHQRYSSHPCPWSAISKYLPPLQIHTRQRYSIMLGQRQDINMMVVSQKEKRCPVVIPQKRRGDDKSPNWAARAWSSSWKGLLKVSSLGRGRPRWPGSGNL